MHLLTPEKKFNIPISLGVSGIVKSIKLRDTRSGKVVEERGPIKNMLLDDYYVEILSMRRHGLLYLQKSKAMYCHIGSNGTPPSQSDQGLYQSLASKIYYEHTKSTKGVIPAWEEYLFIFPAGEGSGVVREVALSESSLSNWKARQVVSPELVKEDYHQLEVTWRREVSKPPSWSGVIPSGSRDGLTDINWVATINDQQFYFICTGYDTSEAAEFGSPWRNIFRSSHDNKRSGIITGTSNAPSDLINDDRYTIKGVELFSQRSSILEPSDYTPGAHQRATRLGFDVNDSNGQIGELIVGSEHSLWVTRNFTGLFRMTFDPPLEKIDTFRLYLDITIGITPS